jgi:glutamate-1-semialdehyde 2,1-aminomutase
MSASLHPPSHNQGEVLGPKSRAEFERSKTLTPGGSMRSATYFAPHPPYAVRGDGAWVTDLDGRRIFDCANNFFSLIHGHAFPPVMAALHDAIDRGTAFGLPMTGESALAEEIRRRAPRLEQFRFVNSGTEAVMFAVKAARAITGRPAIAKFEGAYHGAYDHVEVSLDPTPANWGEDHPRSIAYAAGTPAGVVQDTLILRFNEPQECRQLLEQHRDRLAAVLFDPLASRAGMVPASEEFRAVLQEGCRKFGILLIMDEVISFRLGYGGAHTIFGLEPDLVALAKIIGGGLPVGAVAGPARHMAVFDHTKGKPAVSHGGTFSANPLSMAAGLAALQAYDAGAVARLDRLGGSLRQEVNQAFGQRSLTAQMTGFGSLFRLHLTTEAITDYRSCFQTVAQKAAIAAIQFSLLERGYLLTPNCSGALSTPMTETDIRDLAAAIVDAVGETRRRMLW